MAAETWLKDESNCVILLSESIASAEEWGEDVIRLAKMFSPKNQFLFHLFDEIIHGQHGLNFTFKKGAVDASFKKQKASPNPSNS